MEWYRQVQFIAAVPMPEDAAEELGTTINGMWAAPEARSDRSVARARANGQRVLFSVPLIALVPGVYKDDAGGHLLGEVCRDIDGSRAVVGWYYWEPEPVYAACIYSPVFRRYLLNRCRAGIARGMDVVNLDEINTSIGLMSLEAGSPGFCRYCLARFRGHLQQETTAAGSTDPVLLAVSPDVGDDALRLLLRHNENLFELYQRFHERQAFDEVVRFIAELRAYAAEANPGFAITANVAYLGNEMIRRGGLWGPGWGELLDFVMLENIYQPAAGEPHQLLPRGKFTAWYRLGSAFANHAPAWICPSIMVPRQLAGQIRVQYYLLMFLEAYANGGRWGYNWWPGVDARARQEATVPVALKDYIAFITRHRKYFEQVTNANELAILYIDGCISRKPESHFKYVALAQALAEAGYQFDVVYVGTGHRDSASLDQQQLTRYKALLIPEARNLSELQADALTTYAADHGGELIVFSPSPVDAGLVHEEDGQALLDFWTNYEEDDRQRILASVQPFEFARLRCSDPMVNVIRYVCADEHVLHLVNYNYDAGADRILPVRNLTIRLPWAARAEATCMLLRPGNEEVLEAAIANGQLTLQIPDLDAYGLVVVRSNGGPELTHRT